MERPWTNRKMSISDFLKWIETIPGEISEHRIIPSRAPSFADRPELDPKLKAALGRRGITNLYTHQAKAVELGISRRDFVIVTPTASGKTMCYNIPVLDSIIKSPSSRAIYLFPTKALSQDQMAELHELADDMKLDVRTHTYDGDTPGDVRTKVRKSGHIVITNPDMLHTGILPHHTKWKDLFENLQYVVIDELHSYKGIYGSHLALILRRLERICEFYGSRPTFICCSATIANPRELAQELTGRAIELIDCNGAPSGERHIIFFNPPVVNWQLGIRQSSLSVSAKIAAKAVANGIRTIVFSRSRINVELLLKYIQDSAAAHRIPPERIAGYRGGYLPNERRAIERGLRDGGIHCVVSTNALELGIDIGSLELAVLHGYPGSIASAWQQMGRAGRRAAGGVSAAVMVASSLQTDQFLAMNPSYFFGASPEHARVNPSNPYIQIGHIKCSSFELPFSEGEKFGGFGGEDIGGALDFLVRNDVLHNTEGRYFWQEDSYPAASLSLRSATSENFVIHDVTDPSNPVVIGQMDRRTAPTLIFPQAIYFHAGEPYQVEELDHEEMRCYVKRVNVDYYTDGDSAARIEVLDELAGSRDRGWGEVLLAIRPTIYKKIKLLTHENVGYGHIHLPEEQMHTTAFWINLSGALPEASNLAEGERIGPLHGLVNLVKGVAPLFLMCDRGDIIVKGHERDPHFRAPVLFVADNVPGGIGLAEELFELGNGLFSSCLDAVSHCKCAWGCPACIGAVMFDNGEKRAVVELLKSIS